MNWKLIFLLSLFGLAMGLATIFLIPSRLEPIVWLIVFIISAYLIAKYAPGRYFLHGLLVSTVNGIWVTAAHVIFFNQYLAAHPEHLQMVLNMPSPLSEHPRRVMLLIGPINGVIFGLILGLFAWVASKIMRRSPTV
jgi:hypothetical protein